MRCCVFSRASAFVRAAAAAKVIADTLGVGMIVGTTVGEGNGESVGGASAVM